MWALCQLYIHECGGTSLYIIIATAINISVTAILSDRCECAAMFASGLIDKMERNLKSMAANCLL